MTESIVPVTDSVFSDPDAQAAIWFLGALSQVRVSGAQTGGAFALADHLAQRGNASPVHVHDLDDETFFVLDGELRVFLGEEEHTAGPGTVAVLPRRLRHAYVVTSATARFLTLRLGQVLVRLQDTTAEIRVRFAVLLLVAFTVLAERFGLESILGAFLAGAIVGLVDRDSSSHPDFRTKLDAIGYGFLVPVFFVSSGIRLDLTGLLHSPSALARVPLFLLALLAVRGLPALLGLRANGTRPTLALGLLQATSLPFIVTATQIGVALGKLSSVTAAALVCAGLLSVLIFPLIALGLLRRDKPGPPAVPAATQPVPEPQAVNILG